MKMLVSSPLIRLNPWDLGELHIWCPNRGFIASNSAQSVGPIVRLGEGRYALSFIASNSAQSVGHLQQSAPGGQNKVSSPLIRLNPWDYPPRSSGSQGRRFIASNSAQSVGLTPSVADPVLQGFHRL